MLYIQSGKVKLTVVSQQGKEAVIAILEQGTFWGVLLRRSHGLSGDRHRRERDAETLHPVCRRSFVANDCFNLSRRMT